MDGKRFTLIALFVLFAGLLCFPESAAARPDSTSHTVRIIPGPEFAAGSFHRFLFGELWRDVWNTPVDAEVLDLDRFAGGLTVIEAATGDSAGCLGLEGGDGNVYTFRKLGKNPYVILPGAIQEMFAGDVLRDLVATTNPYGSLVAAPLLQAVGVLSDTSSLVVLPDDDRLGSHREVFGGTVGFLGIHRKGNAGGLCFPSSDNMIVGTVGLLRLLEQDYRNQVNRPEYLKTRIMGMYLGDWDPRVDHWRWQVHHEEGVESWAPIPQCHYSAFSRYDGLAPWIGSFFIPQLSAFGKNYSGIRDLGWSGRHLDRWFLSPLGRSTWDSVTAVISSQLTDSLIERAVRRLPPAIFDREGPALIAVLKERRQRLPRVTDRYYSWLANTVDIRLSNKPEFVKIVRNDERRVSVSIFAGDEEGGPRGGRLLYHREFYAEETREIRLYMNGGNDLAEVRGSVKESIPVVVVGGDGDDRVVDSSYVDGVLFGVVPFIADAETRTYVYDSDGCTVVEGASTEVNRRPYPLPANDTVRYAPQLEDRGTGWGLDLMFDWNAQLGPIAGVGPVLYHYGFRADPYVSRISLLAGYAPFANVGRVVLNADFRSSLPNTSITFEALASGYEVLTYFGQGNETVPARDPGDEYYRVRQVQFRVEQGLMYPLKGPFAVQMKAGLRYVQTDRTKSSSVVTAYPYGIENMVIASLGGWLRWNTKDDEPHPYSGLFVDLGGTFFPKAFTPGEGFGKAKADIRYFYTPGEENVVTLSVRLLGEKTWGKVPYFEAATIGSSTTLRGYQQGRFLGEASLAAVFETRIRMGQVNYVVPTDVGMFGFIETGRVFVRGENSSKWHPSIGGGIWAAPWNRKTTLTASLGISDEHVMLYATIGFAF